MNNKSKKKISNIIWCAHLANLRIKWQSMTSNALFAESSISIMRNTERIMKIYGSVKIKNAFLLIYYLLSNAGIVLCIVRELLRYWKIILIIKNLSFRLSLLMKKYKRKVSNSLMKNRVKEWINNFGFAATNNVSLLIFQLSIRDVVINVFKSRIYNLIM